MHIIVDHVLLDSLHKFLFGRTPIKILIDLLESIFSYEASNNSLDAKPLENLIEEPTEFFGVEGVRFVSVVLVEEFVDDLSELSLELRTVESHDYSIMKISLYWLIGK